MLPPICREMLIRAAGLPLPVTRITRSATPSLTSAISLRRTGTLPSTEIDRAADVIQRRELAGGQHQVLLVVLLQPAHRVDQIDRLEPVGYIHQGQPVRQHFLRVHDHGHFARIRGLHLNSSDSLHPAEEGTQNVVRVVAQILAGHVAVQDQAEDRKHRRSDTRYFELGIRRQVAANLIHLPIHQLKPVLDIGIGIEQDGDLGVAAYGSGAHAVHALHRDHRFFQRASDIQQHHVG